MNSIHGTSTTHSANRGRAQMISARRMCIALLGFTVAILGARAEAFQMQERQALPGDTIDGDVPPTYQPPPPPPETTPVPPYGTHVSRKTSTTVSLAWRDDSEVEDGYRIEHRVGGAWATVAGLSQDTNHCFRVVPWNALGEPAVPSVCTTTTRVTGPSMSIAHTPRTTYADPRSITFATAGRIRVTENFFHHNQKQNNGYGVVVEQSSYAYIDKNTFDYNRHAVASTGGRRGYPMDDAGEPLDPNRGPEHGYAAYLNLVLDGHSSQTAIGEAITWQTHHFDVHGTESNWLGVDWYDGWAGETIDVATNSFLKVKGTTFNVRGTPASAAYFRNNVLPALVPLNGM